MSDDVTIPGTTTVAVQAATYELNIVEGGESFLEITMPNAGPQGPKGDTGSQGIQGERGYSSLDDVDLPNFVLMFENGLI